MAFSIQIVVSSFIFISIPVFKPDYGKIDNWKRSFKRYSNAYYRLYTWTRSQKFSNAVFNAVNITINQIRSGAKGIQKPNSIALKK